MLKPGDSIVIELQGIISYTKPSGDIRFDSPAYLGSNYNILSTLENPYGTSFLSKSLKDVKKGAVIAVPNDTTNEARALLLLEAQGLIKLKDGATLTATKKDIVKNPKNIEIKELEAAQLPRSLKDVDFAVINGNYALQAGMTVNKDALAVEDEESVGGAKTYGNVVAVKKGNEDKDSIKALIKALKSDAVKKYMEKEYKGAVVPLF